ncbi:MAG: mandelate racemase/muconate lactonizing enzyme family protein [Chloroflexota bacterium]|nr:mandelate racemase/muconate lactonizing enzyme family protein [Chloroflexota bacterium]
MKIASYETRAVCVPREPGPPVGGANVAPFVTLTLRTDDGIEGIGYAGFVSDVILKPLHALVNALTELVIGSDPMEIEAIGKRLRAVGGGSPEGMVTRASAAIDVALWDIKGKALGQPVHRLLGGYRDRMPTYASGFLWRPYSLEALATTGARLVDEGYTSMKFRLGGEKTPAAELERARVMREAVGDGIDLMVDINQGWDVNQSISIGRRLEEYGLYWFEDPTDHQDYAGLARIADALTMPVAAGEYHYGIAPFRHMLEQRSIDIVMIDLLRAGGITQWMKAAHMAEAFNLPVVSHLAPEILAHTMVAIPNGLTVENMPWSAPLFQEAPAIEGGEIILSDAPGLGLAWDLEALDAFAA